MKKISAVIPTLLKDKNILNRLINNLVNDNSVEEVIVINNSKEDFNYDNPKLRIISKGKNLYVNPSWNLGVSEAKSEYVTLINDDIIIPQNFCTTVLEKMNEKSGIIGMDNDFVINLRDENNNMKEIPQDDPDPSENIYLKPTNYRKKNFGIIMFFNKNVYKPIIEDLKIFFGDDWIIHFANKLHKKSATICGQEIIHCGSLSSSSFCDLAKQENEIYKKTIYPWYKRIINFYRRDTHFVIYFMFINLSIRYDK